MVGFNINGEYLDLYPDTRVIYDYAPNDFSELTTTQGITSIDFDVPRTAKNERLLVNDTVGAILESEGGSQFKGFLRVHKRFSFIDQKITLFFTASNTEWISLIKGKSIREADLSRYNHLYDESTIVNSFNNTEGFIYPLIDYGATVETTSFEFEVEELAPAIYVNTLLKQIFTDIGVSVKGTLLENILFNKIIIPFTNERLPLANTDFTVGTGMGNDNITGNGAFDFILGQVFIGNPDIVDLEDDIIRNDTTEDQIVIVQAIEFDNGSQNTYIGDYAVNAVDSNGVVTFLRDQNSGISLEVELTIPAQGSLSFEAVASNFISSGSLGFLLRIDPLDGAVTDTFIDASASLPNISQEEFLKYIFFTFGVLAQYDVTNKTIVLNQYNDLEINKSRAINVSGLIDLSQPVEENFDEVSQRYARNNDLEYSSDSSDSLLEQFEVLNGKSYGFGSLIIDNPQLAEETVLYTAPFAGTISQSNTNFPNIPYLPFLPRLIRDGASILQDQSTEPRVLVLERGFDYGNQVTIGSTISSTAPLAYFAKSRDLPPYNEFIDSIAFGNFGIVAPNDTPIINTQLSLISSMLAEGKGLSIYLAYELEDIQNIDFSVPIYIELENLTGFYFISGIENVDGESHSYKFDLIKI